MVQRKFTDEVLDDRVAAILQTKTPTERLEIAFGMWRFAQQMVRCNLQREHPDWSTEELTLQTARRMSHGAF